MKRSNMIYGLIHVILSGISLCIAITFDANKMSGVFYGLTGAFVAGGIVNIAQYFFWKRHNEKYEEKLEIERIEQQDELKQKLRDKSGRYAYLFGMFITALSIYHGIFFTWSIKYHGYRIYRDLFINILD